MVEEKKRREAEPDEELSLEPPLREKRRGLPSMGFGGGSVKTILISLVVTFVVIMGMGYVGGGQFITKKDFTTNLANMITTMDQAKAGLAQAQSSVATAVQAIPTTVSTQVAASVATATTQWTSQLSALSDKVTASTASSQANVTKISELETKLKSDVSTLTVKDTELAGKITALETKVGGYETRIKALEDKVATLSISGISDNITGATLATTKSGVTVTLSAASMMFSNLYLNPGYGLTSSQLYFLASANTTSQQYFNLTINNTTGKRITNLWLQLGLKVVMPDDYSTPTLLLSSNSISVGGFDSPSWVLVSVAHNSPFYFQTGTTSWAFQVGTGISQFQCVISSVLPGTGKDGEQIILQPAIQILGISQ